MLLVKNKKAYHDFTLTQELMAGIVLSGQEVKSIRQGRGSLVGSHIIVMSGEAFLLNAQISPYPFSHDPKYDPKRTRKLLLKKKEIEQLSLALTEKGWTVIPLSIQLEHNLIKVKLALAKGKKQFEKRAALRARDLERDTRREFKNRVRLK